jgi:hypothetical protein
MTVEEFWRSEHGDAARWRKALRREHRCGRCSGIIRIGDRYFDSAELVEPPYLTAKFCQDCAGSVAS